MYEKGANLYLKIKKEMKDPCRFAETSTPVGKLEQKP